MDCGLECSRGDDLRNGGIKPMWYLFSAMAGACVGVFGICILIAARQPEDTFGVLKMQFSDLERDAISWKETLDSRATDDECIAWAWTTLKKALENAVDQFEDTNT